MAVVEDNVVEELDWLDFKICNLLIGWSSRNQIDDAKGAGTEVMKHMREWHIEIDQTLESQFYLETLVSCRRSLE